MIPLTLTPGTVPFKVGLLYNIPKHAAEAIGANQATRFPAPWVAASGDPGIQITITNNATFAPIAPILMDEWTSPVDGLTYRTTFAELTTVQPGATVTETVAGLPVTPMLLVLWYLAANNPDINNGWTVDVQAWAV